MTRGRCVLPGSRSRARGCRKHGLSADRRAGGGFERQRHCNSCALAYFDEDGSSGQSLPPISQPCWASRRAVLAGWQRLVKEHEPLALDRTGWWWWWWLTPHLRCPREAMRTTEALGASASRLPDVSTPLTPHPAHFDPLQHGACRATEGSEVQQRLWRGLRASNHR